MSSINLRDGKHVVDFGVPYVIAEVNSSHNGNPETAKQMIDAAVDAGCDCVKFQSWSAESLYSKTYYRANPLAKRFVNKFSMPPDMLKEMAEYCKYRGISFSSTPYSSSEADFLADECNVPFIKISSMEINNPEYLRYIAKKQIPIVLSTGMSDYGEVKNAVQAIESTGNQNIVILHCVAIYPTPIEKAGIHNILTLRKMFPKYPVGFSDHTLGDEAAVAATALGAAVLEKHITLDSTKIGMDNQMAMEPEQLSVFVRKCKSIPMALGTEERILWPEELKQRKNMRRSIVSTRLIKAGETLRRDDLTVKRPGTGIEPIAINKIIGCKAIKDIEADTVLSWDDINQ